MMSRVIKCRGTNSGPGFDVWINPDQIKAYSEGSKSDGSAPGTALWFSAIDEDYIIIEGSVDETLTRFGFNNGSG